MPAYYYHTNIGDRGMRLSDGQRQRLSIVRAVFKNPAILILDEATLVLDTESERLVQDALKKLMVGRTTLVRAHRLSTIIKAYEILVMQDGRIVERGSHQDLIEMEAGIYRILTLLQKSLEYSVRGHCKGCKKDSCANRMLPNFCLNNCYLPKHVNKVNN